MQPRKGRVPGNPSGAAEAVPRYESSKSRPIHGNNNINIKVISRERGRPRHSPRRESRNTVFCDRLGSLMSQSHPERRAGKRIPAQVPVKITAKAGVSLTGETRDL